MTTSQNGAVPQSDDLVAGDYEPWLFQAMLDELKSNELGIGFVYSLLDLVAQRYGLKDVTVKLMHDTTGLQCFRLGRVSVDSDILARHGRSAEVISDPDVIPENERNAIRTACQLSLSLHLARYSSARDPLTNISNRRSLDTVGRSRWCWPTSTDSKR